MEKNIGAECDLGTFLDRGRVVLLLPGEGLDSCGTDMLGGYQFQLSKNIYLQFKSFSNYVHRQTARLVARHWEADCKVCPESLQC